MSENPGRYDIDVPSSSSPDEELFEAAKNGKLDDFKKLCDEKKLNPLKLTNKPDLNFPIHEAASNDQVDIIAEILKRDGRNEMLESKNVYGQTPLHVAAMYNRTKTIEFLIDNGANPNSKDKNESTALQLSIEMQKTYSSRTLLKKDGVDFQTENTKGNTLLHTAAENGSADLCKVLVKEKNVNIKKLNKDKEHALFGVLRTLKGESTKEMLCYLFDKCIDPEDREKILTKENAKGETLLNVARQYGNKEVIKYLKQLIEEIDMSALIVDKNKKFNQVKLFVCGSENVGKTTLIKSLESKDALLFRTHNDGGVHDPTPGIDIKMCDFPVAGIFSVWDFAGQPEFYLTHPLFMDAHNAITILVYKNITEERQQSTFIITKIMEWLRFLKASTDETKPSQKKPTIILVGTHSDEVDRQRAVKQGEFLVKHLKEKFSKWLNILDEVIVVDARQPYDKKTEGMGLLRTTLRDQRNSYLEVSRDRQK
ncbi:death-associated protein kinase 1-like isoform X1 [Anneissia japonica]|uniref:death-associated protein kinase 1-like isoform X1 n=1 Tax=Anneissia japonica TaxID=1529436 RepID=UPI001425B2C7|nr:death-associated protein kinase 1-like isoform X1 [Anneissia japonica]